MCQKKSGREQWPTSPSTQRPLCELQVSLGSSPSTPVAQHERILLSGAEYHFHEICIFHNRASWLLDLQLPVSNNPLGSGKTPLRATEEKSFTISNTIKESWSPGAVTGSFSHWYVVRDTKTWWTVRSMHPESTTTQRQLGHRRMKETERNWATVHKIKAKPGGRESEF